MTERYYQQVLLVREGEGTIAWVNQESAYEGCMVEQLHLPNPRDLWTVRHISNNIRGEIELKEKGLLK